MLPPLMRAGAADPEEDPFRGGQREVGERGHIQAQQMQPWTSKSCQRTHPHQLQRSQRVLQGWTAPSSEVRTLRGSHCASGKPH